MGFFDWLSGAPSAPTPKPPDPPVRLAVAPEGGAWMVGADEDGTTVKLFIAEGIWLPKLGTVNYDDNGKPVNYFASNGWNPFPINPKLFKVEPYLTPFKP